MHKNRNKVQNNIYKKTNNIKKQWYKRPVFKVLIGLCILSLVVIAAFRFSPWPSALIIRYYFNKEAVKANAALSKHVKGDIAVVANQQYDPADKDAMLDIYYPSAIQNTDQRLPVIVWIHGGAWVSGKKEHLQNYCKLLAAQGYVAVSIDYSISPGAHYPTPIRQTSKALTYLIAQAKRLHIDDSSIIIAGDSGGAHIAAQTANIIVNSDYADLLKIKPTISKAQLAGLILYCGPYDTRHVDLNGDFGSFLKTILWSYSGNKNFLGDESFKTASVIDYINADFPPCFISAGNGDPLLVHSENLARKLVQLRVPVDTLFFDQDLNPALPHEYQFNLDNIHGEMAFKRSVAFLDTLKQRVIK